MMSIGYIVLIGFLLCIAIYTASFGVWTWKRKNRFGAFMIFMVALIVVVLPVYILLFTEA